MQVAEEYINYHAIRLINDLLKTRYDIIMGDEPADERGYMLMTIGEIGGIVEMAEAMKEVIKA